MISTSSEGEILVQLNAGHAPTDDYIREIRARIKQEYPSYQVLFRPADIISQTLNGTAQSAIEVNLTGRDIKGNLATAKALMSKLENVEGVADIMLGQIMVWPDIYLSVDSNWALTWLISIKPY